MKNYHFKVTLIDITCEKTRFIEQITKQKERGRECNFAKLFYHVTFWYNIVKKICSKYCQSLLNSTLLFCFHSLDHPVQILTYDSVAEWSKACDLKSLLLRRRRFESCHCRFYCQWKREIVLHSKEKKKIK